MFLAGVAHPVERHLAKVEVASSSLVTRSNIENSLCPKDEGCFLFIEPINLFKVDSSRLFLEIPEVGT